MFLIVFNHANACASMHLLVEILLDYGEMRRIVVYFDQQTHAWACVRMVENDQNHCKMSEKVLFHHAYERLTNKIEEKSLLVSDWEWLLKAGWHLKAGCSFGILLFLFFFQHAPLVRMIMFPKKFLTHYSNCSMKKLPSKFYMQVIVFNACSEGEVENVYLTYSLYTV